MLASLGGGGGGKKKRKGKNPSAVVRRKPKKVLKHEFYWKRVSNRKQWTPVNREQLKIVSVGSMAYLYGGIGQDIAKNLCVLDTIEWNWKTVKWNNSFPYMGRYNHTWSIY